MDDKARDRYLTRKYGITLAEYLAMLEAQKGVCAICKKPPVNNALSVDHCHKWREWKITTSKHVSGMWVSTADYAGRTWSKCGSKKNDAIRIVRKALKRASVRGLLCFPCNSGLRKYSDDPSRLANAAEYLEKHQQNKEN